MGVNWCIGFPCVAGGMVIPPPSRRLFTGPGVPSMLDSRVRYRTSPSRLVSTQHAQGGATMASQNYSEKNTTPGTQQGTRAPAGKPVDARESGRDDADAEPTATAEQALQSGGQDPRDGVPGVGR